MAALSASAPFGAALFVAAGAFVFAFAAGAVTGAAAFVAAGFAGAFVFATFVVGAAEPQPMAVTTRPASAKLPATFKNTFLVNVTFSSNRTRWGRWFPRNTRPRTRGASYLRRSPRAIPRRAVQLLSMCRTRQTMRRTNVNTPRINGRAGHTIQKRSGCLPE